MSSVSSVGSGSELLQYLQQLAAQNLQQASTTSAPATPTADSGADAPSTSSVQPHGHHGGHHHAISSQLEDAITSALDSSDGTTDPNQVVQSAIEKFLNPSGATSTPADPATDPTQSATVADPGSQQSAFNQVLQANGINPSQFRQDFSTALQSAQSSGTPIDFTQIFKNFPPGTTLDTTA